MSDTLKTLRALERDTFDQIALRVYGYTSGVTEQIAALNPQIGQKSPILAANTLVYLPNVPAEKIQQGTKLWA